MFVAYYFVLPLSICSSLPLRKGVSEGEVTSEDREHAKRIVYSVVYGAGECQRTHRNIIRDLSPWRQRYSSVKWTIYLYCLKMTTQWVQVSFSTWYRSTRASWSEEGKCIGRADHSQIKQTPQFDYRLLPSAWQSALEQDTQPQIQHTAPKAAEGGLLARVKFHVWTCM